MKVKRIVANVAADKIEAAQQFYGAVLGLELVMDHGWISTYASDESANVQISFASQGGNGTPVPDLSIEVDDVDVALERMKEAGFPIEYGPADEVWGVRRFYVRDPFGKLVNILAHISQGESKPVGLTATAGFQVGIRRTLPISREQAWAFITSTEGLSLWIGQLPKLELIVGETFKSHEGVTGRLKVVKPLHQLRLAWQPKDWERPSTLQIRLLSNTPDKTTISFHQEQLDHAARREQMKLHWENVLAAIADHAGKQP